MLQNFAHFVRQFGIQNLILSDSLQFSALLPSLVTHNKKNSAIQPINNYYGMQ